MIFHETTFFKNNFVIISHSNPLNAGQLRQFGKLPWKVLVVRIFAFDPFPLVRIGFVS